MFNRLYKKLVQQWSNLSKKRQVFYFVTLSLLLLIIIMPVSVRAGVGGAIASFLGVIIGAVITVLSSLITIELNIFAKFAQFNNFLGVTAVKEGWKLVRDLCNMFFIVILLVISFATILKLESYSYKKWLGKLVIAAILINFSKTITGFLIGFSQIIMLTFVSAFKDAVAGNLAQGLHLTDMMKVNATNQTPGGLDSMAILEALVLAWALLTVFVVVMLIMIVILVGRIVTLWVLVILSPIAYLLQASPFGEKYAKQWWQEFGKNLVSGPVLAFFLWLAFLTIQRSGERGVADMRAGESSSESSFSTEEPELITGISKTSYLMDYIVTIALLLAAIKLTQSMGVIGSSFAGKMQQNLGNMGKKAAKIISSPLALTPWAAKQGVNYAGRKYNEAIYEGKLPRWSNPFADIRAWKARSARLKDTARKGADAGAEEAIEKTFTGVSTSRRLQLKMAESAQFSKDFDGLAKEEIGLKAFQLMNRAPSSENLARRRALVKYAFQRGYDDDVISDPSILKMLTEDEEYKEIGKLINVKDLATGENGKLIVDKEVYSKFYEKFVGQDQAGLQLLSEGDDIAHKTKHSILAGLATYDPQTGEYRMANTTDKRKKVGQDLRTGEDVYAGVHESQNLEQLEFNKEPGRDKLKAHIHGVAKLVIYDRKEVDSETGEAILDKDGKQKITKVLGVGDIDEFIKERQTAAYGGQTERGFIEHTVERTVNLLMGGEAAKMAHTDKGLHVNGNALKNIALLDQINDIAIDTLWKKTGGQTTKMVDIKDKAGKVIGTEEAPNPTFIVAGKSFTLDNIRKNADKIMGADTKEKWDEILERESTPSGRGASGGPSGRSEVQPPKNSKEVVSSAKEEITSSTGGVGNELTRSIENNFNTINIEHALNSIEGILNNVVSSLDENITKGESSSIKMLQTTLKDF